MRPMMEAESRGRIEQDSRDRFEGKRNRAITSRNKMSANLRGFRLPRKRERRQREEESEDLSKDRDEVENRKDAKDQSKRTNKRNSLKFSDSRFLQRHCP